jgi:hypothetical protein
VVDVQDFVPKKFRLDRKLDRFAICGEEPREK